MTADQGAMATQLAAAAAAIERPYVRCTAWPFLDQLVFTLGVHDERAGAESAPVWTCHGTVGVPQSTDPASVLKEVLIAIIEHL